MRRLDTSVALYVPHRMKEFAHLYPPSPAHPGECVGMELKLGQQRAPQKWCLLDSSVLLFRKESSVKGARQFLRG